LPFKGTFGSPPYILWIALKFALATTTIIPWKLGLSKPTHIIFSFKHVQNTIWGSNVFAFISHKEMNNRQWQKRIIHMGLHYCPNMHCLNVIKHHPRNFQIYFYHSFYHCGHFEQDTRLVKWLSLKRTSLYVVVCTIVFDTQ
jgi:hypothetical protein